MCIYLYHPSRQISKTAYYCTNYLTLYRTNLFKRNSMGSQKNVNRPEVFLRSRLNRWKALCLGCSTFLICRCLGTKQVGVPSSNGSEELYIRGHDGNPCHFKQKYIYRLCVYLCLFLSLFFYIHRSRSIYKQPTPVGRLCILTSKKKQGTAVGRKVQLFFFHGGT